MSKLGFHWAVVGVGLATLLTGPVACGTNEGGGGGASEGVEIDADDIGGLVTSEQGPEAGVWVIAETQDLPTKYIKSVVTDDVGRYVIPDLPDATYDIWVRGYGLVDSEKVQSAPGHVLDLTAVVAPDAAAAAHYYPANYWYALLEPPPKSDFPGTGRNGNGVPENLKTQGAWLGNIKMTNACTQCHQMGTLATREVLPEMRDMFDSSYDVWEYRLEVGISGSFMASTLAPLGRQRAIEVFADWGDRIAAGELPEVPPRPQGLERNVVVTQWEYATEKTFAHDVISTDRRDPTINAYGPIVGVEELSGDWIALVDPVNHTDRRVPMPPHDPSIEATWGQDMTVPSPYWGEEVIWAAKVSPHNPMFDAKGRVWITARGGCRAYHPDTDEIIHIPECPVGHHLQIDDNDVLWGDGGGGAWFDTKYWDETGDAEGAAGRIPNVIDTNANGQLDEGWVGPDDPIDPAKDTQIARGQAYSVIPNPVDGSVWISYSVIPGVLTRYDPETQLSEVYEVPYMDDRVEVEGYLPHGIDVDRSTGVIWTGLNSGHFAEFDRSKCTAPLNGPEATGRHCPEGWTLHETPGPNFKGVTDSGAADSYYLNWVDWYNTSGFGDNTPILTGTGSDSLIAYDDGEWVIMRVPYPLGFSSARPRWTHRRSRCGLEGARALVDPGCSGHLAPGRWKG